MNALEQARRDIDEIDSAMAELFVRRMEAAARVLDYKRENSMSIFDPEREAEVLAKGAERVRNAAYSGYYRRFVSTLLDISKDYQQALLEEHRKI